MNPNGTPQESGFSVQHTAGSGLYRIDFPAGTFAGSAGKFLIATVGRARPSAARSNPNGTPQESGFSVQHTAGSGLYRIDFPAGTFTGSAGKFLIATVTPIGGSATFVDFASSIAPIAADGSGSFEVHFNGGETLFDYVVAVSISASSAAGLPRSR